MVVQKYGTVSSTARRSPLPPRLALLFVASTIGWAIEWLFQWSLPALVLPVGAIMAVNLIALRFESLRQWSYLLSSIAIGMTVCARLVGDVPPVSARGATMLAWLDGTVEDVLSYRDSIVRCIVRARLDPKYLPPLQNARVLLRSHVITEPAAIEQQRIVATVSIRLPRINTFPYEPNEWQYAAARGVDIVAYAVPGTTAMLPPTDSGRSWLAVIRQRIGSVSDSIFSDRATRLLSDALVFGQREQLDRQIQELFSRTGTAHLLSVSGFHVGVIATIIAVLSTPIRHRLLRYLVFCLCVWSYVLLTGASPPSVRAGIAASAVALALQFQRWVHPLQAVLITLWTMIAVEPRLVLSVSFQMSAVAVVGIVTIGERLRMLPLWQSWEGRFRSALRTSTSITLGATLATAPIVAWYFGSLPVLSLLANIVVVPLASLFILASGASIAAGSISIELGKFYAGTATAIAHTMLGVIEPIAAIGWTLRGTTLPVVSFVSAVGVWYAAGARSSRHLLFRTGIAAVSAMLVWQIATSIERLPWRREIAADRISVIVERIDAETLLATVRTADHVAPSARTLDKFADYLRTQHSQRLYIRPSNHSSRATARALFERIGVAGSTTVSLVQWSN